MVLVLRALDATGDERTIDAGRSFSMGRGSDNDWVLQDPSREVSKTHCRIEGNDAGYVLTDLSVNGVFIEGQSAPMHPGGRHTLASGDVFSIGQQRFAVTIGGSAASPPPRAETPAYVPDAVSSILEGGSDGVEARASGRASGDAERWLGTLPAGAADETLRQPMGWEQPPATSAEIPVVEAEFDQKASDFASRSEHVPANRSVMHLPRSQQLIPMDWLDEDDAAPPAAPSRPMLDASSPAEVAPRRLSPQGPSAAPPAVDARRPLAAGGRLNTAELAALDDATLFQRCGEALRALLDGLDAIEAAQGVAENDCTLPSPSDGALWTDFFATNRDPLLSLLAEPGPASVLAQRVSAIADRQRALGQAVSEAAAQYDARFAPAAIEQRSRQRLSVGPLAKAAAWTHYCELRAELAAQGQSDVGQTGTDGRSDGPTLSGFFVLLRKSFARATGRRP